MELNIKLQVVDGDPKEQARKLAESLEYLAEHLLTAGMTDFTHKREGIIGTGQFQLTQSHINALERNTISQIDRLKKELERTDLSEESRKNYTDLLQSMETMLADLQGTDNSYPPERPEGFRGR
jgi:hypothetical protein